MRAIGEELGLTRSTTRRILLEAGKIAAPSEETVERRGDATLRLARHLGGGASLPEAAQATGVSVHEARLLIKQAGLLCEPLPRKWHDQARKVRRALVDDDVRAAASSVGLDPWWAAMLLILTGDEPMSMQPRRQPAQLERLQRMAARRAQGATYEQIGAEFGLSRERVRRLLQTTPQASQQPPP